MNKNTLFESIGHLDEELLLRSEQNKQNEYQINQIYRKKRKKQRLFLALAGIFTLTMIGGYFLYPKTIPSTTTTPIMAPKTIFAAEYPTISPYPVEDSDTFEEQYEAWLESTSKYENFVPFTSDLKAFFSSSIPQILDDETNRNRIYSPLNVYLALGMLAEITDSDSRQQILDTLHMDSLETLRTTATNLWNSHYKNDKMSTSILASSLWLNDTINFTPSTLQSLTDTYHASSYQGTMGTDEMNTAFQQWSKEQTGGLFDEKLDNIELNQDMVMALATTLYFQATWSEKFDTNDTVSDTFHSTTSDITCDFMKESSMGHYYWGNQFGAVSKQLGNTSGTMWFLLPDEGVSVNDLLHDKQVTDFLLSEDFYTWENSKFLNINLSVPKFNVSSEMDLIEDLKDLGITNVFDDKISDFSPLTDDNKGIYVSNVPHIVGVGIDEEGVTASSFTSLMMEMSAGMPNDDTIDFVLNRPFIFAIISHSGIPLFVGVVEEP